MGGWGEEGKDDEVVVGGDDVKSEKSKNDSTNPQPPSPTSPVFSGFSPNTTFISLSLREIWSRGVWNQTNHSERALGKSERKKENTTQKHEGKRTTPAAKKSRKN